MSKGKWGESGGGGGGGTAGRLQSHYVVAVKRWPEAWLVI